jgi:NAD(P)-dependent dehydrogenase (short-subunit alcohol dehydrogenase family)
MLTGEFPASATLLHGQSIAGREMPSEHLASPPALETDDTSGSTRQIRVNAVLPGRMKTPMVEKTAGLAAEYGKGDIEEMWKVRDAQCPMGHMGDAWDVAYACLYLASGESKYVTGLEQIVDGGLSLKLS